MTITAPSPTPTTIPSMPKSRLDWVDNLRTLMIFFVVNIHACVTYSHVGSWYYNSPPEPPLGTKIPFLFWEGHLQSFFMGLLFMIAGYYADRSLRKRGARQFIGERMRRLGIPTLIYMMVIHPFIILVLHPGYEAPAFGPYWVHRLVTGSFLGDSGPMWFAFALLLFSLIFAAVYRWLPKVSAQRPRMNAIGVIGLGIAIALPSFLVRTVQPIGTSILNFQLCFFAQYLVAFALGIWVSRKDMLSEIAESALAKRAGLTALVLGPLALLGILVISLPLPKAGSPPFMGGWNLTALLFSGWEQLTGVALGLGAMALCARRFAKRTALCSWLSDRSFGVYFVHPPILIAISLLVQPIRTNALIMAPVVTVLALAASFAAADLARRIPLLKEVV